ncbi:redoxin domain-containing protein [Haloarcula sp. Atlit-120R]|uniref:redoxin domain-containing protein n=1 Tax=Haloarcula sp. Atlit-120R TaxID=2282135 RepID=UPI000EF21FC2|nr:redoxin domain-containing protein [Haloarcula sp. Atlit-120R]RLM32929.1 peroxiredoxin [Haloarcula sp. Atlit-120R]
MVTEGDSAPTFTLPGVVDDTFDTFSLSDATDRDSVVLLLFYPFDFSPVCTNELCAIRDAEWFELTPDLDVWAASGDSAYSHRVFAEEYGLNFPLLSDSAGSVASAYDVCYNEWENHESVPQRAVFLIDSTQTIRYAWSTDDALKKPDFFPVKEALDQLTEERDDFGTADVDLVVEYDETPSQIS